ASTAVIVVKMKGPAHVAQAATVVEVKPVVEAKPPVVAERTSVILRSDPPGAVVIVDEQPVATTPTVVQLLLPHDVTVQLDGYHPQTQRVETAGELTVRLVPVKAKARPAPRPQTRLLAE